MNKDQAEFERVAQLMEQPNAIFVFGSNLAGIHGAGAARAALEYGAVYGQGEGLAGRSYALPTKDEHIETMPIGIIKTPVRNFRLFATLAPQLLFVVTRIGCGLAGYTDEQIAPLFTDMPANVALPIAWKELIDEG
jgi:hypothetical protein